MVIARAFVTFTKCSLLCAALALAACGQHGVVPTQAEQSELQSAAVAQPGGANTFVTHRFGHFMHGINLSDAQQAQLQTLIQQFRQAHPPGSPFDPQAIRSLHEQMLAVLTPDQQLQLQQNMAVRRIMWHHSDLNLTAAQQAQIQQLVTQYRAAHPEGSTFDPQARQQLHQQIWNILTPAQQTQIKQGWTQLHATQTNAQPPATVHP